MMTIETLFLGIIRFKTLLLSISLHFSSASLSLHPPFRLSSFPSQLLACCLSRSDLSISHKLSVPNYRCPLTLKQLRHPHSIAICTEIILIFYSGAEWRQWSSVQSNQVKAEDTEALNSAMSADICHC